MASGQNTGSSSQDKTTTNMETDRSRMPAYQAGALQKLQVTLVDDLQWSVLRDQLIRDRLVDSHLLEELDSLLPRKAIQALLEHLTRTGTDGFSKLMKVFKETGYGHLEKKLEELINQQFPKEIKVVLFGKTGVGKSKLGNALLGREAFESELSSNSVTSTCSSHSKEIVLCSKSVQLHIIDTPGLSDTTMSTFGTMNKILECMKLACGNVDIFIMVLQLGIRITEEEKKPIEIFNDRFGDDSLQFVFIVFTHKDVLLQKGRTVEDWIEKNPFLSETVKSFGNRYCAIGVGSEHEDVDEILKCIKELVERNNYTGYTSEIFSAAAQNYHQRLEDVKKRLEDEKNKEQKEWMEDKERQLKAKLENEKEKLKLELKPAIVDQVRKEMVEKKRKRKVGRKPNLQGEEQGIMDDSQGTDDEVISSPKQQGVSYKNIYDKNKVLAVVRNYCIDEIEEPRINLEHIRKILSKSFSFNIPASSSKRSFAQIEIYNQFMRSLQDFIEDSTKHNQKPQTTIDNIKQKLEQRNGLIRDNKTSSPARSDKTTTNMDTDSSRMPAYQAGALQKFQVGLVGDLPLNDIRYQLFREGLVDHHLLAKLDRLSPRKAIQELLIHLTFTGTDGFSKLMKVFKETGYGYIEKELKDLINRQFPKEIKVVLFGKTQVGKSNLGNALLGREAFKSESSPYLVTSTCSSHSKEIVLCSKPVKLHIIDTPCLFNRIMPTFGTDKIIECMKLAGGNVDIFIMVFQLGIRITEEERKSILIFKDRFGGDSERFILIVFTHKDVLEKNGRTVEDWIEEHPFLSETVKSCGNRYCAIGVGSEHEDVDEILKCIKELVERNNYTGYTSEIFSAADQNYHQRLEDEKKRLEEEKNKEVEKLVEDKKKEWEAKYKNEFENEMIQKLTLKIKPAIEDQMRKEMVEEKKKGKVVGKPNFQGEEQGIMDDSQGTDDEVISSPKQQRVSYKDIDDKISEVLALVRNHCIDEFEEPRKNLEHIVKILSKSSSFNIPASSSKRSFEQIETYNQFIRSLQDVIEDSTKHNHKPQTTIDNIKQKLEQWNGLIRDNKTSSPARSDVDSTSTTLQDVDSSLLKL